MAAFTSKATGNWSAAGQTTWNEVGVPVAGDTVTIANTHVITVDDTSRACAAITLNGTLKASRTANCKLAYSGTITINSTGWLDWGTEASPIPSTYTATLAPASGVKILLDGQNSPGGKITMRGDSGRNPWTTVVTASLSAPVVADATGWKNGDELLFVPASATNNNANHTEIVKLGGTYVDGSTTLDFDATPGDLTQTHIAGGRVCNLTRNCVLEPSSGTSGLIDLRFDVTSIPALSTYFRWARFKNVGDSLDKGGIGFVADYNGVSTVAKYESSRVVDDIDSCVFYRTTGNGVPHIIGERNGAYLPVHDTTFVDTSTGGNGTLLAVANNIEFIDCTMAATDSVFSFYTTTGTTPLTATRCWFSAGTQYNSYFNQRGISGAGFKLTDCIFSGRFATLFSGTAGATNGTVVDSGSDWGRTYGIYLQYRMLQNNGSAGGYTDFTSTGGKFNDTYTDVFDESGFTINRATSKARLYNKNGNTALQEFYTPQCRFSRDAATVNRSTSSLKAEITTTDNIAQSYTFQVPAKNGESLKMVGYLRKNASYGSSTRPTVTASYNGSVLDTYTLTDVNDTWEVFDLDFSQSSGTDGLIDITFTVQSSSSSAIAYLSGVSTVPFVTRSRHYGYLFTESSPTVLVDAVSSAAFATADAYTGMTITWGASASSTAITASNTFQKLYDYHQAKAVQNVGSAVALTGAGVAGSPALFAQGNVTISDGAVLNSAGSISMGAYTLSTEFASGVNYTFTGGTWSQATTVPTVAGGQLNIPAAGSYVFTMAGSTIISMTPTAPGTYAMGAASFTGTVDLRNTAAHAITVELPSGTSYTTASNTGGTITVSLPVVTASVSITGMPDAGAVPTRLQIINTTAETAAAWQATTAYTAGAIRLRTTGTGTENTAGLYLRCTTSGTSAGTEPTWNTTPGGTTADGTAVWTTYKILFYDADPAGTSYSTTYIDGEEFLAGEVVEVRFAEMDGGTSFKTYGTATVASASGFSALVAEVSDDVYATYGLDGSAYESTFSPNFTADYIVLDTNADFSGKSAFAYFCYTLTSSNGMYQFWRGVTAIDPGNLRIESDVLDLYFDESAGFVKQTDDVRIFRKDGTRPAIDPTTGGHGIELNWRTPVSVVSTGGSALTPTESAQLMALPSATANATAVLSAASTTPIAADMKKTNGETIVGDGTESNKFRSHLV